ncbi:MAG: hypothetical protein J4G09_04520 [Proteobacteria bacterium]|nr:hypothetical protein [Pseudomonadota bacterium]
MRESAGPVSECWGIDAGASLWKLATARDGGWDTRILPQREAAALERGLPHPRGRGGLTGGGARAIARELGLPEASVLGEFDCWISGAPIVAAIAGLELPEVYLLVSVGTGASAILVREGAGVRVGGTALGGGSLMGLGRLLLGKDRFGEIVALAAEGRRERVDLLLGDLYGPDDSPLPLEVPAAHFAKLESAEPADLAAALIGMVAHNLGLICGQLALAHGAPLVMYCGSTLNGNDLLRDILNSQTGAFGVRAEFPGLGAFCGAIGAAARAAEL